VEERARKEPARRQDLAEQRKVLHGQRRQLHERLAEVCEEFVLGDLTRPHKKQILVRELQYLLDYYQDEESWQGID
jgi:hypothetical protein